MISHQDLKNRVCYDPVTGVFTWLVSGGGRKAGDVCGCSHNNEGYVNIQLAGKMYRAHRLAWFYVFGRWPDVVDHINGNRKDNRLINLRNCTHRENIRNSRTNVNNTSGVKGVGWCKTKNRWRARIEADGKDHHIGYFSTIEEAEKAVVDARNRLHGCFARHK